MSNILIRNGKLATKVIIRGDKQEYWNWCSDNATGWLVKEGDGANWAFGIHYYYFFNPEDATAFKLRFGL